MPNQATINDVNHCQQPEQNHRASSQITVTHEARNQHQAQEQAVLRSLSVPPSSSTTNLPESNQQLEPTRLENEEDLTDEAEGDRLDLLDVPDVPSMLTLETTGSALPNTTLSAAMSLVGMPLPANFVVADALYPILPPAPELEGRCQSKYLRDSTHQTLNANIKFSRYWRDHQGDTIFLDRPTDDNVVSVDDLRRKLSERRTDTESNESGTGIRRSQSRSVSIKKDSVDVHSSLEKLERSIAEIKAKQAALMKKRALEKVESFPSPASWDEDSTHATVKQEHISLPPPTMSKNAVNVEQDTEDVLAALGVTGSPKPVGITNTKLPEGFHALTNGNRPENPFLNGSSTSLRFSTTAPRAPPPLHPSYERRSSANATSHSPSVAAPCHVNGHALHTDAAGQGNVHTNKSEDEFWPSPREPPFEGSGSRKRSYSRRHDTSSSEEDAPRRQEEDVTPKYKRRQPKVAPAYR